MDLNVWYEAWERFEGPRCGDNDWVMMEGVNVMKRENTDNIYSS
jgi:hypothetical protein